MRNTKPGTDAPKAKRRPAARSSKKVTVSRENGAEVDAYISRVPEPARTTLQKVRATIRAAAPAESTEALSYGMPAFLYKGALVAYAAFKKHCSLFPMSLAVLADMKDELAAFQTSKGTLQFPLDKPLPTTLVRKIVKARVAEKNAKAL